MATIDIDTAAVIGASCDLLSLQLLLDDALASLRSTAARMDWQFEGADACRNRLDALASRMGQTRALLDRHRGFLMQAAARFDRGEQSVLDAVPGIQVRGDTAGAQPAVSGGGGGGGADGSAPDYSFGDLIGGWVTDSTGQPKVGTAAGDIADALFGRIPLVSDMNGILDLLGSVEQKEWGDVVIGSAGLCVDQVWDLSFGSMVDVWKASYSVGEIMADSVQSLQDNWETEWRILDEQGADQFSAERAIWLTAQTAVFFFTPGWPIAGAAHLAGSLV